jgi:galactose mutarotase-like enzyme
MHQPAYLHERNFGCRVTEVIYRGLRSFYLENELLRVLILADKGGDIVEFVHKPTDTDFLWRSPNGVRDPRGFVATAQRPEGAFLDFYPGGWQDCLPTGGDATDFAGTRHGPHGEFCLLPWQAQLTADEPETVTLELRARGYRTPLFVTKRFTLQRGRPVLFVHERVVNEGAEAFDLVWGQHPAFGPPFLDASCVVDLPAATVHADDRQPTHRYRPGTSAWPLAHGRDGTLIDISKIPPPDVRTHDTVFLTDLSAGWYAVTNTGRSVGFGMCWPLEVYPAIWFWQSYGGAFGSPWFGRSYNIALEPWTTAATSVNAACANGTARTLAPGAVLAVDFCAVAYSGLQQITAIHPDGTVVGLSHREDR